MDWVEFLGYAASASVLLTFCMSTMLPLRVLAISSNVLFAAYGAMADIYPVLALHVVLLPVNVFRLVQILRVARGVKAANASDVSIESLLPYMSRRNVKAGEVLITKGERADSMYYLFKGTMQILEIGKIVEAGALFGEIGIFGRERRRTATVVCISDCEIYEMTESKAKQLYYQDPAFGFAIIRLVIDRLLEQITILKTAPDAASRDARAPSERQVSM